MASTATTSIPRRRAHLAALTLPVLLATAASHANEQSSTLQANPAGSLSIEQETPVNEPAPSAIDGAVGPPIFVAEALDIEPAPGSESSADPSPASASASKPLGGSAELPIADQDSASATTTQGGGWGLRTALALAAVIGLILLCKMAFLKLARQGGGTLSAQLGAAGRAPSGLLSVLARYPIAKGNTLVLLRLDRRVLLLSQTNQGFTTLAEIDDPEEVAALIMRAEDEEGASLTRRFRSMLTQAERDPGLIGEREYEIDPVIPMTPRAATARFHEIAQDIEPAYSDTEAEHADAVGSLRDRLRSLREVTA